MTKMFKVTTRAITWTHYYVEAESAEEAEYKYADFETVEDDPLYGDAEEEVLEVEELNVEELKAIYEILNKKEKGKPNESSN